MTIKKLAEKALEALNPDKKDVQLRSIESFYKKAARKFKNNISNLTSTIEGIDDEIVEAQEMADEAKLAYDQSVHTGIADTSGRLVTTVQDYINNRVQKERVWIDAQNVVIKLQNAKAIQEAEVVRSQKFLDDLKIK